jgi:hypothetical protein
MRCSYGRDDRDRTFDGLDSAMRGEKGSSPMKLDDLPQFAVREVHDADAEGKTLVIGHLSHLQGVHGKTGFLYRAQGPSIMGDLEAIPSNVTEPARFRTADAGFAPELKAGAVYPWLDGSWKPYHLKMVLSPAHRWQRRSFSASPARFFLRDGVTSWQDADAELPRDATDLGVHSGDWNRACCELCPEQLEAARSSEGYVDDEGRWICAHCFEKYARRNDISFALGDG